MLLRRRNPALSTLSISTSVGIPLTDQRNSPLAYSDLHGTDHSSLMSNSILVHTTLQW